MTAPASPRPTLGLNKNQAPRDKDPGRKALRPAGRKQAAGLARKDDTPPQGEERRSFGRRDERPEAPRGEGRNEGRGPRQNSRSEGRNFGRRDDRPEGPRGEGRNEGRRFDARGDQGQGRGPAPQATRPVRSQEAVRPHHFEPAEVEQLSLFLPCGAGVQDYLAQEVAQICGLDASSLQKSRGGVALQGDWHSVMRLNLHSRLAQRVLIEVAQQPYRQEQDLYDCALQVPWERWFGLYQSFKIDWTAQGSPLKSLNFAALKIKDAIADRFREKTGARPNVDPDRPDVRVHVHFRTDDVQLYIDTSGQPLFKRGWRFDKGEAPLKETLAATLLVASGWQVDQPLYDPSCGSGTIAIEAALMAANIAPGLQRSFGFERLKPFVAADWQALKTEAQAAVRPAPAQPLIFGSDVAHRMVDFAQRNAERAGVAQWLSFRGGDALQRRPPCPQPGWIVLNPPYGERIATGGFSPSSQAFFVQLAQHWKAHYAGWQAWVLSPDLKLPATMRLAESRKVPLWNGPIECRLFRFDLLAQA